MLLELFCTFSFIFRKVEIVHRNKKKTQPTNQIILVVIYSTQGSQVQCLLNRIMCCLENGLEFHENYAKYIVFFAFLIFSLFFLRIKIASWTNSVGMDRVQVVSHTHQLQLICICEKNLSNLSILYTSTRRQHAIFT